MTGTRISGTNGLRLRPLRITDLHDFVGLFSDRSEYPLLWHEIPESVLQGAVILAKEHLGRVIGSSFLFAIEQNSKLIGVIGFRKINPEDCCGEPLAFVKKELRGRGVFTDMVRAVVDFGFFELGLNRIYFYIDPKNESMRGKIKKLQAEGVPVVREGLLRQNELIRGDFVDDEIYGLIRSDWIRFNQTHAKSTR
jgi:ribosomal-protein-alanine N-acetyltransferase